MAKLSTIPAEIISMILLLVQPEDLENFAQCCKEVRQQAERKKGNNAQSLLQVHRTLIRKYSNLTKLEDIAPFLKATTASQHVARYVRKMDLGPVNRDLISGSFSLSIGGLQDIFEDREIYEFLVSAAKAIQFDLAGWASRKGECIHQRHRDWTIQLVCENADLAVALLAPLLPNLSALAIPWRLEGRFRGAKHWIEKLANSSNPILKKLKKLQIHSAATDYILSDLSCLIALPSLQTLAIKNLRHPECPPIQPLWPQPQSQPRSYVKNLELWNCNLRTWMLEMYLQSFHNLKSFAFRGGTRDIEVLNPMPIFTILLSHSQHTLTKLYLHSFDSYRKTRLPFKRLPNLKELSVGWEMLLPQPYFAGENWEPFLPQSLEALTIHDGSLWHQVGAWNTQLIKKRFEPIVEDLLSCKTNGLPGLRNFSFTAREGLHCGPENPMEVDLVGIEEVELDFRSRCAGAGLSFSFKEHEWQMVQLREEH